jgi:chitinase
MKRDMLKKVCLNTDFSNLKSNRWIMAAFENSKRGIWKGKTLVVFLSILFSCNLSLAQTLPANVMVGYYENWNSTLTLTGIHNNYNVIILAFGLPKTSGPTGTCKCDITFALPSAYGSIAAMNADIDILHAAGKKVLLSLGGATGPILLSNTTDRTTFETSVEAILAAYSYKIDGIDLDLETTSMTGIPGTWTMSSPAAEQTNMVTAVQNIATYYQAHHPSGNRMLLTMAPEVYYINGALSAGQITSSGGIFLPILVGLSAQLDLLHMQLYNSPGGMNAWNGTTYFEATGDFAVAMNETVIKGFTLLAGKGTFGGISASKLAFGLPATPNASTAGSGFLAYTDICKALQYIRGTITKPAGWSYNRTSTYPSFKGVMTWDVNEDKTAQTPSWQFATNACAIPAPVTLLNFDATRSGKNVYLNWATANETNNDYYSIERSPDGISFFPIASIEGLGTNTKGKAYNYTDDYLSAHTTYYRLAQYDMDGTVHYSPEIVVIGSNTKSGLTIQNNPFENSLYVLPYGENQDNNAVVNILDYSGKLLISKSVHINEEIPIGSELTAGLYFVQFVNNGEITNYKVIKQ